MSWGTVSKEQHRKLPQCGRPRINWSWHWFRSAKHFIRAACRERRLGLLRIAFYTKMRMANAIDVQIGPVCITWPMRWLDGPARQLHPEVFNDDRASANGGAGQKEGA